VVPTFGVRRGDRDLCLRRCRWEERLRLLPPGDFPVAWASAAATAAAIWAWRRGLGVWLPYNPKKVPRRWDVEPEGEEDDNGVWVWVWVWACAWCGERPGVTGLWLLSPARVRAADAVVGLRYDGCGVVSGVCCCARRGCLRGRCVEL